MFMVTWLQSFKQMKFDSPDIALEFIQKVISHPVVIVASSMFWGMLLAIGHFIAKNLRFPNLVEFFGIILLANAMGWATAQILLGLGFNAGLSGGVGAMIGAGGSEVYRAIIQELLDKLKNK